MSIGDGPDINPSDSLFGAVTAEIENAARDLQGPAQKLPPINTVGLEKAGLELADRATGVDLKTVNPTTVPAYSQGALNITPHIANPDQGPDNHFEQMAKAEFPDLKPGGGYGAV